MQHHTLNARARVYGRHMSIKHTCGVTGLVVHSSTADAAIERNCCKGYVTNTPLSCLRYWLVESYPRHAHVKSGSCICQRTLEGKNTDVCLQGCVLSQRSLAIWVFACSRLLHQQNGGNRCCCPASSAFLHAKQDWSCLSRSVAVRLPALYQHDRKHYSHSPLFHSMSLLGSTHWCQALCMVQGGS